MSDTPKTTAAMASFNEQCDQPVAASEMAALERENAKLREVGDVMAKIIDTAADADVSEWPTNDELSAAVDAWNRAKS